MADVKQRDVIEVQETESLTDEIVGKNGMYMKYNFETYILN